MIDGFWQAYGHELRKARKAHRCEECDGTIQPGEQYNYHHGVWEGQGTSTKVCRDCDVLRHEIDAGREWDDGTAFGELCEAACEERTERPALFLRYVAIRKARGATVSKWMESEYQDLTAPASAPDAGKAVPT